MALYVPSPMYLSVDKSGDSPTRRKARIRSIVPSASGEAALVATSVQTPDAENRTANCCSRSLNSSSFSVHAQSNNTAGKYFIIPL